MQLVEQSGSAPWHAMVEIDNILLLKHDLDPKQGILGV